MKDQQPQTYVTKHDLELLHKKIIATDLIVQKYQEVNKALCRLQSENDALKQQVEQTTNECCIFSRQVTECTQESDDLKEQIELLHSENRELHQQLRVVKDENTSNCHEIMVLKQYESLKETNDQLSKTVDRQQKQLAKVQLQLQRKSPMVYKPVKNKQEPSETDIALVNSQKSVRELKLALGRLVNFIELSKLEIPVAFYIRPVLKAHGISDDFVEAETGFVLKPVKKVSRPVITPVAAAEDDDDDDEDDDNDDFIDVNHIAQPPAVADTAATALVNVTAEPSTSSKSTSRQRSKKEETSKPKATKKSRHRKDKVVLESSPTKLDDLANKLELALSQPDQQPPLPPFFSDDDDNTEKVSESDPAPVDIPVMSQPSRTYPGLRSTITITPKPPVSIPRSVSFFRDDDNTEKVSKPDPAPVDTPVMTQSTTTTYPGLRSTITITPKSPVSIPRLVSFFSDDDNDGELPSSPSVVTPVVEQKSISTYSSLKEGKIPSSRINHATPMEVETMHKPMKHVSFLSEDDDDDDDEKMSQASASTSIIEQQPISNTHIPTLENSLNDNESQGSFVSTSQTLSNNESQPTPMPTKDVQYSSSHDQVQIRTPVHTLDSKHVETIFRLLHILTHVPTSFKPLRLVRRRIQQKIISVKQVPILVNDAKPVPAAVNIPPTSMPEIVEENSQFVEVNTNIQQDQIAVPIEEERESIGETITAVDDRPTDSTSDPIAENNDVLVSDTSEEQQMQIEDTRIDGQLTFYGSFDRSLFFDSANQSSPIIEPSIVSPIPKLMDFVPSTAVEQPVILKNEEEISPPLVSKAPKQSVLKPFHLSVLSRLLNTLTTLPVKPLALSVLSTPRKVQRKKPVLHEPPTILSRPTPYPPTRMQTRSLNSIRACIARCNQPNKGTRKRTTAELASPTTSTASKAKRMKTTTIEPAVNEDDQIEKFLNSFSKELNDESRKFIERKLREELFSFGDTTYQLISEVLLRKCDIILPLVNRLHPSEETMKVLLMFIHTQSKAFSNHFINKLTQGFRDEIKQPQQINNRRIKIFNRLFFLSSSIFSSPSVLVYARLFDIGYSLSRDTLVDALCFLSNTCPSLITKECQVQSSTTLLHQTLFDLFQTKNFNISLEYLHKLLLDYHKDGHNQEDLRRSFLLLSRQQPWSWNGPELCSKLLLPLMEKIDPHASQRLTILIILQDVLFTYKDEEEFRRDMPFHGRIKQFFQSLKTLNIQECTVRDKILSILRIGVK